MNAKSAPRPASKPGRCATTSGSGTGWPSRPRPCAAPAGAGRRRSRRRSAWRDSPRRPSAGRCPGSRSWPSCRSATPERCRPARRGSCGSPRRDGRRSSARRTPPETGPSATTHRPARTPARPTACRAARASPTGSPRPPSARSQRSAPSRPGAGRPGTPAAAAADAAPHQRRIGPIEPGVDQLAVKHRSVDVRVVLEPRLQIATERLKTARRRLPALARRAGQVLRDRLAVPTGVPRDRGLRPAARNQCVYLHVVLLGQHPPRSSSLVLGLENRGQ